MSRFLAAAFLVCALVFSFAQFASAQTAPTTQESSNTSCPATDSTHEYAGIKAPASRQKVISTDPDTGEEVTQTIYNLSKKTCTQSCPAGSTQPNIQGMCVSQDKCIAEQTCSGQAPQQVTLQQIQSAVQGSQSTPSSAGAIGNPAGDYVPGTSIPSVPTATDEGSAPAVSSPSTNNGGVVPGQSLLDDLLNPQSLSENPNLVQDTTPAQETSPDTTGLSGGTVNGISSTPVTTQEGLPNSAQPTNPLSPTTQYPTDTFGQPTYSGTAPVQSSTFSSAISNAWGSVTTAVSNSLGNITNALSSGNINPGDLINSEESNANSGGAVPVDTSAVTEQILQGRLNSAVDGVAQAYAQLNAAPDEITAGPDGASENLQEEAQANLADAQAKLNQAMDDYAQFENTGTIPASIVAQVAASQQPEGAASSIFGSISSSLNTTGNNLFIQSTDPNLSPEAQAMAASGGAWAELFSGESKDAQKVSQLFGSNPDTETIIACASSVTSSCTGQQIQSLANLSIQAIGGVDAVAGSFIGDEVAITSTLARDGASALSGSTADLLSSTAPFEEPTISGISASDLGITNNIPSELQGVTSVESTNPLASLPQSFDEVNSAYQTQTVTAQVDGQTVGAYTIQSNPYTGESTVTSFTPAGPLEYAPLPSTSETAGGLVESPPTAPSNFLSLDSVANNPAANIFSAAGQLSSGLGNPLAVAPIEVAQPYIASEFVVAQTPSIPSWVDAELPAIGESAGTIAEGSESTVLPSLINSETPAVNGSAIFVAGLPSPTIVSPASSPQGTTPVVGSTNPAPEVSPTTAAAPSETQTAAQTAPATENSTQAATQPAAETAPSEQVTSNNPTSANTAPTVPESASFAALDQGAGPQLSNATGDTWTLGNFLNYLNPISPANATPAALPQNVATQLQNNLNTASAGLSTYSSVLNKSLASVGMYQATPREKQSISNGITALQSIAQNVQPYNPDLAGRAGQLASKITQLQQSPNLPDAMAVKQLGSSLVPQVQSYISTVAKAPATQAQPSQTTVAVTPTPQVQPPQTTASIGPIAKAAPPVTAVDITTGQSTGHVATGESEPASAPAPIVQPALIQAAPANPLAQLYGPRQQIAAAPFSLQNRLDGPTALQMLAKIQQDQQVFQFNQPGDQAIVLGILAQETLGLNTRDVSSRGAYNIGQSTQTAINDLFEGATPNFIRAPLIQQYGNPAQLFNQIAAGNWQASIDGAVAEMSDLRYRYGCQSANCIIAGYNGGPARGTAYVAGQSVPFETANYVPRVDQWMNQIASGQVPSNQGNSAGWTAVVNYMKNGGILPSVPPNILSSYASIPAQYRGGPSGLSIQPGPAYIHQLQYVASKPAGMTQYSTNARTGATVILADGANLSQAQFQNLTRLEADAEKIEQNFVAQGLRTPQLAAVDKTDQFYGVQNNNKAPLTPQQVLQSPQVMKVVNDYLFSHAKPSNLLTSEAAQVMMTPEQYMIGGMDAQFRMNLYFAGKQMDALGVGWTIADGFRGDPYQSALCANATGACASTGHSFHGGSAVTGGYQHGLAADIDGAGQSWLLQNGAQFGIGHPYSTGYDAPHFTPINSPEYIRQKGQAPVNYQSIVTQQETQLAAAFPQTTYNIYDKNGNLVAQNVPLPNDVTPSGGGGGGGGGGTGGGTGAGNGGNGGGGVPPNGIGGETITGGTGAGKVVIGGAVLGGTGSFVVWLMTDENGNPLDTNGKQLTDGAQPAVVDPNDAPNPTITTDADGSTHVSFPDDRPVQPIAPNSTTRTSYTPSSVIQSGNQTYCLTSTQPLIWVQCSNTSQQLAQPPRPPFQQQPQPIAQPLGSAQLTPLQTPQLSCSPSSVSAASSTTITISWICLYGTAVSNGFSTQGSPFGQTTVQSPQNATSALQFGLQCTDPTGVQPPSAPAICNVAITGATSTPATSTSAAVVTLVANPTSVASGGESRLSWSSVGTVDCRIGAQGEALIGTTTNGSAFTPPLSTTTTFTALCDTAASSTVSATTNVIVQ